MNVRNKYIPEIQTVPVEGGGGFRTRTCAEQILVYLVMKAKYLSHLAE